MKTRRPDLLPKNHEVFGRRLSATDSEVRLEGATIERHPDTGDIVSMRTPDGWSVNTEFLSRISERPGVFHLKPSSLVPSPTVAEQSASPSWVEMFAQAIPISQNSITSVGTTADDLDALESDYFERRRRESPEIADVEQAVYRYLVEAVVRETGCAETRAAISTLLQREGEHFFAPARDSIEEESLADSLVNLALVARFRSGSAAVNFPRLLREVVLEIADPSRLRQDDTPSCYVTSLQYMALVALDGAARYVRNVTELATFGYTLTSTAELVEASEWWVAERVDDQRTQSLRLVANALYAGSLRTNPDQLRDSQQLIYSQSDRVSLASRVWGREVVTASVNSVGFESLFATPPFLASIRYRPEDSSEHAVVVLRRAEGKLTFFNPHGRLETCPEFEFRSRCSDVMLPAPDRVTENTDRQYACRWNGVSNWNQLANTERAAALASYAPGAFKLILSRCELPRHWLQVATSMRIALELVDLAQRDAELNEKLNAVLAELPGTTYPSLWERNQAESPAEPWRRAAAKLRALPSIVPTQSDVQALAARLAERPSDLSTFTKVSLYGARVPLLAFPCREPMPLEALDANLEQLLRWLDSEHLLGAACRGLLPLPERSAQSLSLTSGFQTPMPRVSAFISGF